MLKCLDFSVFFIYLLFTVANTSIQVYESFRYATRTYDSYMTTRLKQKRDR